MDKYCKNTIIENDNFHRISVGFESCYIIVSMKMHDFAYFGLLVEVGSLSGKNLGNSHFILLCCQMESSQATLHEETHRTFTMLTAAKFRPRSVQSFLTAMLMWLTGHCEEERCRPKHNRFS